jgi:hypothetical protein
MNKIYLTLIKIFENIEIEYGFDFIFQIIYNNTFDRKEIIEFLTNVSGTLEYDSKSLTFKKFIIDRTNNISKLLKFIIDFNNNEIKQFSISSNYPLISLNKLKTKYLNDANYSKTIGYRDDSTMLIFNLMNYDLFESIKAYAKGIHEDQIKDNDLDLYQIIITLKIQ